MAAGRKMIVCQMWAREPRACYNPVLMKLDTRRAARRATTSPACLCYLPRPNHFTAYCREFGERVQELLIMQEATTSTPPTDPLPQTHPEPSSL
ncbi:hypothetical protein J6590_046036 [Homalodisca vitripennis]|nr:hypothetical protein J6590_046036 [Homalodisca vitripennis]